MYLFQRSVFCPQQQFLCPFTFHYVSISTVFDRYGWIIEQYLHSTMYLFQQKCKCILTFHNIIYIPLCIYFNKLQLRLGDDFRNLHSTMYLFQPTITVYGYSFTIIYIPLCIYFNTSNHNFNYKCHRIYIQLFIY